MQFAIQVGTPTILHPLEPSEDLAEAIEDLFSSQTEDAFLIWNGIPVRIGYKYNLSYLIDELLRLLSAILRADQGQYLASWTSSSFFAYWNFVWDERQLTISAQWHKVPGRYEALLNSRNTVQISCEAFLREWKGLLSKVIEAISVTGIEIEEQEEVEALYEIEAAIGGFGQSYEGHQTISPISRQAPADSLRAAPKLIGIKPLLGIYADVTKERAIRAVA